MSRVSGRFLVGTDFIQEAPTGTINGSNVTFTLSQTPNTGTLLVYLDALYLRPTTDYTVSGTTLTMGTAPATGQILRVAYWRR